MQRDKLTADPKYFITCQIHSILIIHELNVSFNQHQHGNNLSALNAHMTTTRQEYYGIQSQHLRHVLNWYRRPREKDFTDYSSNQEGRCTKKPNKQQMSNVYMMEKSSRPKMTFTTHHLKGQKLNIIGKCDSDATKNLKTFGQLQKDQVTKDVQSIMDYISLKLTSSSEEEKKVKSTQMNC